MNGMIIYVMQIMFLYRTIEDFGKNIYVIRKLKNSNNEVLK